jgi:uncharacterized protein
MQPAWRQGIEHYIEEQARPVDKFGHQPRLYELTLKIGAGLVYDDDVVFAATWLHDVGVFIGHRPDDPKLLEAWNNVTYALEITPGLLAGLGFPADKIEAVCECIRTHQPHFEPTTIEATILRDADMLEQLGAVGILRTISKVGRDTRFATFSQAVVPLQRSLEQLPPLLRLPVTRALAEARIATLQTFLQAVDEEAGMLLL